MLVGDEAFDIVGPDDAVFEVELSGSPAPLAAASRAEVTRPEPPTANVLVGEAGAT